ncbi:hypothetical protein GE061_005757 [Apolygus lucorum]|uniref:Uncharacterized protein n=1 Tax=Apolygus lucorum TaxID=248454 RepID=A0A8S9WYL4_APOLU|nr:hypothetical protein GE061_005757 [Apolygus lucorum]
MDDGIVVKEEPMSGGDEDQLMEEVEIKEEELIGDEYVKQEVGSRWRVEDAGCTMFKREDSSAADESDDLQGPIGVQRSQAGPSKEPMSGGDEDQLMEEVEIKQEELIGDVYVKQEVESRWRDEDQLMEEVEIKQEELIGDEYVELEVGSRWREEDDDEYQLIEEVEIKQEELIGDEYVKQEVGSRWREDAGCTNIKREDSSAADESDDLQGPIGVQRSEAGPSIAVLCNGPASHIITVHDPNDDKFLRDSYKSIP